MTQDMESRTDSELVSCVIAGEFDCFSVLVKRHAGEIYSALRFRGLNEEDAREVARESLLRGYTELGSLWDFGELGSMLHGIAEKEARNFNRLRRRTGRYPRGLSGEVGDLREQAQAIWVTAAWMPEDYRHVFFQKYLAGRDCEAIAERAPVTIGTATSRLRHAHELLGAALRRGEGEPGCEEFREANLMAASGEEPPEGAEGLADHLLECGSCAAEKERLRRLLEELPRVPRREAIVPEGLIFETVKEARGLPLPRPESQWPVRLLWVAIGVTAVTLALALWGVLASSPS